MINCIQGEANQSTTVAPQFIMSIGLTVNRGGMISVRDYNVRKHGLMIKNSTFEAHKLEMSHQKRPVPQHRQGHQRSIFQAEMHGSGACRQWWQLERLWGQFCRKA